MIDNIEKMVHKCISELFAINYGVEENFTVFDNETREEISKKSNFKIQNEVIERICIYQSESPSFFVNVPANNEDPDPEKDISIS